MAKHRRDTGYTRKSADPTGSNAMTNMPPGVDAIDWIITDARGYFAFGRMLAGRTAHREINGTRLNTHRAETEKKQADAHPGTHFANRAYRDGGDVLMDEILQGQGARA